MSRLTTLTIIVLLLMGCGNGRATISPTFNAASEAGMTARAAYILRQQARCDLDALQAWFDRAAYFQNAGGDPHKYALSIVLAKIQANPTDPTAIRMLEHLMRVNARKGDRGLYHFAVYQRTRLYFQFRDLLPKHIVQATEYDVQHHFKIMLGNPQEVRHGTENHTFMHRSSGYLWAEHLGGADPESGFHDEYTVLRQWVIDEVQRLYRYGQGEYDSSTYVGYSLASLANIFDFSTDPVMREVARAGMDWMLTALARKYVHGCQLGPESRGFARSAVGHQDGVKPRRAGSEPFARQVCGSSSDWVCWLYFGDSARPIDPDRTDGEVDRFPVTTLAQSGYRPDPIITAIARKEVALPYAACGSKPPYLNTSANRSQEVFYHDRSFSMGTLYTPDEGVRTSGTILPQTTMFKLLTRGFDDVWAFGMGNGYHGHFPLEGRSPYDQYHQAGAAALDITWVPSEEDARTKHRSVFGWPRTAGKPEEHDGWYIWVTPGAFVAARPLNGKAAPGLPTTPDKTGDESVPVKDTDYDYLISPGKLGGWVVQVYDNTLARERMTPGGLAEILVRDCPLDRSRFDATHREVSFTALDGTVLKLRHTGGPGGRPDAWVDGKQIDFESFPVYDSPYVRQLPGSGILDINDGSRGLRIDVNAMPPQRTTYRQ